MKENNKKPAVLLLEDGKIFYGKAAGREGISTGELCFNTGMTGYQEVFTDPSYFGQLLISTNVHVGNYGVLSTEEQSDRIQISGLICREFTDKYSRQKADGNIDQYFKDNDISVIYDVDTRLLVRHIRSKGAMNGVISTDGTPIEDLKKILEATPSMEGLELASKVSTKEPYTIGDSASNLRVAVLDFGTKRNILKNFASRGCFVKIFPAKTNIEELLEFKPDGFFLSNGPGDPASMDYAVSTTRKILDQNKPVFGICLGHQILSLANGIDTFKMHHGHRGANQPVKNLITGKCEVTSQNHGFAVDMKSLHDNEDTIEITHINLNDQSIEGIRLKNKPAFSVQYHPEASPGPNDAQYLFNDFIDLLKQSKNN